MRKSIYAEFFYDTLPGKIITVIIGKLHIFFVLASPLVAFSMLRASLWIPVSATFFPLFPFITFSLGIMLMPYALHLIIWPRLKIIPLVVLHLRSLL